MSYRFVRPLLLVAVLCFAIILSSSFVQPTPANAQPAKQSGMTLIWSDEFSGGANTGVNTGNWLYDTGTCYPGCPAAQWGTGEVETMTTSTANVFQDGAGHLVIKAINSGGNWTAGRIETQRTDFQPPAGGIMRVEASLQQPNVSGAAAAGYWPAFWMLGAPFRGVYTNWPGIGEIDIMEDINGRSSEFSTLHCGVAPGGPCNEFTGMGSGERACSGCQTGFHTYAVEFDKSVSPQQLRFYLDGSNFFTINSGQFDATTWNNATNHGFFIILNLAMGGGFPAAFGGGPTASTVSGGAMVVDYVRVYYSGTTPTTIPPTSIPPTSIPPTSIPGGSNTLYVVSPGALSGAAGGGASSDTIASAGGANHDGTPTNPLTYNVSGVNGTYNSGATAFNLYVDAGTSVGNGTQARVSYDFTGDGTWDRVETYNYFATDPVVGWELYNQTKGVESSSGAFSNMSNGKVKLEVWNAIGNGTSLLRTNASSLNGQQSTVTIPYSMSNGGPAGYTFCANENGTCSFSGTASVAYGANGAFNYQTATNSIACNNTTFGDPIPGTAKACYYKITSSTTSFSTGLESGQPQPTWSNTIETQNGGLSNVGGICCGLTAPELGVRNETTHGGSAALMYSGLDNSASGSYAYLKVFDVSAQNLAITSTSKLSYWIFPQSSATSNLVSGNSSSCVAIDMVFTDGSNLRDSGVTDQTGDRVHPAFQCGHLTMDAWNNVTANLGSLSGKTVARIVVAYDQPANTGGYRGYVDDIAISTGSVTPTNTPVPTFVPPTNTPAAQPTATTSSSIPAWQAGVAYSIGQQVTYGGHIYKCIQAHTSQVGWEPPSTPALWQFVS